MGIHVLPPEVAAKIAAGEVVERPASVVKELIENSIDARAHDIKVEARGGGQRLIRIMDDGDGIPADQVLTAFERHATSKLTDIDDLSHLHTLGFRGEALPTIASVSRLTLITRARGEEAGTMLKLDGGKITVHQPHGAPAGTIVTVEDLFQHVPARLKFLKAVTTESAQIAELVGAYAMAYPDLRFSLLNEGRLTFQTAGNGKLMDVLVKIFGAEVARQMIPIGQDAPPPEAEPSSQPPPTGEIRVAGYVSPPAVNRSTRKYVFLFVNGRWIEDRALAHAVTEAYHTLLMIGRFPIAVLDITLPSDMVDVNVHPAKSQVRFRDPNAIYTAVQRTVRGALVKFAPVPTAFSAFSHSDAQTRPGWTQTGQASDPFTGPLPGGAPEGAGSNASPAAPLQGALAGTENGRLPMLRVLGQIGSTYILCEGPDGMYILDQHAAHERILFDRMRGEHSQAKVHSQTLLEPASLELTPAQWSSFERERDTMRAYGFDVEEFGGTSILIRAIPAVLKASDPRRAVAEVLDDMSEGSAPLEREAEARLITSICKSAAIKGGQVMSLEEMRELVRQLEQSTSPRTCPHGRPTAVRFELGMLEREFGRK